MNHGQSLGHCELRLKKRRLLADGPVGVGGRKQAGRAVRAGQRGPQNAQGALWQGKSEFAFRLSPNCGDGPEADFAIDLGIRGASSFTDAHAQQQTEA